MDSPSAQLFEPSMIDFDGPPSSPFVTEVDAPSRSPSKQWQYNVTEEVVEENLLDFASNTPHKPSPIALEDKENVPQQGPPSAPISPISKRPTTPKSFPEQTGDDKDLYTSYDSNLMPPPSSRKVESTPKKTPLKSSRSGARTPKSISRGNSFEQPTPVARTPSTFQRALDGCNDNSSMEDRANLDDTCFSTFSEIPDMTIFAKLRQSPTKQSDVFRTPRTNMEPTPRTSRKRSSPSRSPSPTPRKHRTPATLNTNQDGTTNFLIDFTQQMEGFPSQRLGSPAKSATESNLLQYINNQRSPNKGPRQSYATPSKSSNLLNLLDFELPPAPTPRSVPTITVRELESLKSSYLSQISSLKATLSGREAEVESLKKAVGDAERRVGEAQESLREEKCRREHVEKEKEGWEKRGQEVEQVLKSVKEEVIKGEAEKEEMAHRLEDAEKRADEAEARSVKAEERFADALAARSGGGDGSDAAMEEQVQKLVAAQIDAKIEAVSRELHSVYKEKHERKVATLKKSYEARGEKKMAELQSRVSTLERENQDLQAAKDATFSGQLNDVSILNGDNSELKAQLEEQKAHLARLESEIEVSRAHQAQLETELQQERIEKGDLVAAVDEMLALQTEQPPAATPGPHPMQGAMDMVQDFRKSIGRPAGLKTPGGGIPALGESRIGRSGVPSSISRPAIGGKSKMLANIERMGRTGSKDGLTGVQ